MDKTVIAKIKELEKVMRELSILWEQADEETQEKLTNQYPFDKSFDEVLADVQSWCDALEELEQ